MRIAKLGKSFSECMKLKLLANTEGHSIKVTNISRGVIEIFASIRSTVKFRDMHHSYFAKWLKEKKIYFGKGYRIVLNK
jgi:hypothetical protein